MTLFVRGSGTRATRSSPHHCAVPRAHATTVAVESSLAVGSAASHAECSWEGASGCPAPTAPISCQQRTQENMAVQPPGNLPNDLRFLLRVCAGGAGAALESVGAGWAVVFAVGALDPRPLRRRPHHQRLMTQYAAASAPVGRFMPLSYVGPHQRTENCGEPAACVVRTTTTTHGPRGAANGCAACTSVIGPHDGGALI